MDNNEVLDRKTIEAGRIFIHEGDDGYCAYLVQSGRVRVFTMKDEKKIELAQLGPGSIIGEVALILDEPRGASVETIESSVVVTISRDDFEQKLRKSDKTIRGVLKLLSQRLKSQNFEAVRKKELQDSFDDQALALMESFSKKMSEEKRLLFMEEVTPHMNNLIKALKAFKNDALN